MKRQKIRVIIMMILVISLMLMQAGPVMGKTSNTSKEISKTTSKDWKKIYRKYLLTSELPVSQDYKEQMSTSYPPFVCLFDLNGDKVPELFYYDGSVMGGSPWIPFQIYSVKKGQVKKLYHASIRNRFEIFQSKKDQSYRVIIQNGRGSWPFYEELTMKGEVVLFDLPIDAEDWTKIPEYKKEFKNETLVKEVTMKEYPFQSSDSKAKKEKTIQKLLSNYKSVVGG